MAGQKNNEEQSMYAEKRGCPPSPNDSKEIVLATLSAHAAPHAAPLLCNIDASRPALVCLGCVDYSFLNVGGEGVEGLLNVDVALGRDLKKGDAELVGELLALLGADSTLLFPVAFVANKNLVNALAGVLLDIREPCANI